MIFFDKYIPMVSKKNVGSEELYSLCELAKCIEMDETPPIVEECLIVPFYVHENARFELYEYEFYVAPMGFPPFEERILGLTGKKKIEEVPKDIIRIRKICFAKIEENNQSDILKKMKEYFEFLMQDEGVAKRVMEAFAEFDVNKLFVCIY